MPHSSGGGSHGGGGHGGGFGGHGGGGGSRYRTSKTNFAGARKYVYYHHRKPVVVYTNYDYRVPRTMVALIMPPLYFGAVGLFTLFLAFAALLMPLKIRTNYDTGVIIEDNADLMTKSEEKELKKTLKVFLDKTGISPAVVTINNEDWTGDYKNLEKYSYDLYLDMFEDEKHWLIVYSEPITPDEDFIDWYWEGMQGNNTDNVLTETKTNKFNEALQKRLTARTKYTIGEAFTDTFDEFNDDVMKREPKVLIGSAIYLVFGLGMGAVAAIFVYIGIQSAKHHRSSIECKEEVIRQIACSYCGGIYIVGHHDNCPYCQAQVPLEYSLSCNK